MILLAFSKVLIYSDGHSLERYRDMKQREWHYLQINMGLCSVRPTYVACGCHVGIFLPGWINYSVSSSRGWTCITHLTRYFISAGLKHGWKQSSLVCEDWLMFGCCWPLAKLHLLLLSVTTLAIVVSMHYVSHVSSTILFRPQPNRMFAVHWALWYCFYELQQIHWKLSRSLLEWSDFAPWGKRYILYNY